MGILALECYKSILICCGRMEIKFTISADPGPGYECQVLILLGEAKGYRIHYSLVLTPAQTAAYHCLFLTKHSRNCWALEISFKGHWFQPFTLPCFPQIMDCVFTWSFYGAFCLFCSRKSLQFRAPLPTSVMRAHKSQEHSYKLPARKDQRRWASVDCSHLFQ